MKDFINVKYDCGYCKIRFDWRLKLDDETGLPKKFQNVICPNCSNWLPLRSFID